jgi:signal transduction histidine kinase
MATAELPGHASRAPPRGASRLSSHRSRDRLRPLRLALWPVGLAAGIGVFALVLSSDGRADLDVTAVLIVLSGWSFIASGLIAWGHRPESRLGPIMACVGLSWLVSRILVLADSSPVHTTGIWLGDLWVVIFAFFLVTFPHGRLTAKRDYALIAPFFIAVVPLELLWLLFWASEEGPENALLTWRSEAVAADVDAIQRALIAGGSVVLTGVLAARWLIASPAFRRVLTPILVGAVAILLGSSITVLAKVTEPSPVLQWVVLATTCAVPLAVLAGMLRARLARSGVGDLMVELREAPAPGALRDALARALHDPSLTLAYWVPEYDTYVGADGLPTQLPPPGSGRVATLVERGGSQIAALVHDESLADEPELVGAVSAAAGIALENERLQAELRARLEELRGSRARIVEAGDSERRRLERNLHDGVQQRLVSLLIELRLAEASTSGGGEESRFLSAARDELAQALEELREVAHGIHPAILSDHGLAVALESVAARAPLPVELRVGLEERLPEPVEVAAYYLVCEALSNVAKYAQASVVSVEASRVDERLVVEVADDGIGGANTSGGSGLRGLADRVEALGGRLRVWSPAGGGTRIRAEIPCA